MNDWIVSQSDPFFRNDFKVVNECFWFGICKQKKIFQILILVEVIMELAALSLSTSCFWTKTNRFRSMVNFKVFQNSVLTRLGWKQMRLVKIESIQLSRVKEMLGKGYKDKKRQFQIRYSGIKKDLCLWWSHYIVNTQKAWNCINNSFIYTFWSNVISIRYW